VAVWRHWSCAQCVHVNAPLCRDERNYHIFYQLIAGGTPAERAELRLAEAETFRYLNMGGVTTVPGTDDAVEFSTVRESLLSIGVGKERQHSMWRVLAGILHLGNVEFSEDPATGFAAVANPTQAHIAGEYLGAPTLGVKLVCSPPPPSCPPLNTRTPTRPRTLTPTSLTVLNPLASPTCLAHACTSAGCAARGDVSMSDRGSAFHFLLIYATPLPALLCRHVCAHAVQAHDFYWSPEERH
jgi:hypothetical protein